MSETVQPTASTSMVQLGQIIAALGGELVGPAELEVSRIAPIEQAQADAITFLANPKYRSKLATTAAGCVVVAPLVRDEAAARGAVIVAVDPYLYFAHLTQWWARRVRPPEPASIHQSALIHPSALLGEGVTIGPLAVVEADVVLGAGVVIGSHSVVGRGTCLGVGTRLAAHVAIGFGCHVGERCIFHSGVVIGADGFGFAPTPDRRWEKIEQLGAVRIGNDVEIGANSCVDRGALGDTVIEDGVKIDNLVQIGHNVRIGAHAAMAGCVGIAGSSVISAHCTIGGAAMISGHLTLGEGVHVSAGTLVSRSIQKPGLYSGVFPFDDHASWEKNAATLRSLHALRDRVRALEKQHKNHDDGHP